MTQTQQIKEYMEKYGSITPLDAMREFHCMRLAARINDLERAGMKIIHETSHYTNSEGKRISFACYKVAQ